jgi:hypothetical protein
LPAFPFARRYHEFVANRAQQALVKAAPEVLLHRREPWKVLRQKPPRATDESKYKSAFTTSRRSVLRGRPMRFAEGIIGAISAIPHRSIACITGAAPLIMWRVISVQAIVISVESQKSD